MIKDERYHRVFLVEDDLSTLNRLADIIRVQENLLLVGTAATLADANMWLQQNELDVLLTDLGLPDGNGKQLIEFVRAQHSQVEIMVISRFGDENSVVEAIKSGASGYLLKDESEDYIIESINQLLQGGSPISPAIARYILDYFQSGESSDCNTTDESSSHSLLTPKEKLVLQHISRGYSNKEIAKSLEISPHTVASHIKRIYRKLEVNSRNEAVFEGWRAGEISMRHHNSSAEKGMSEIAQALKQGGKQCHEILEVLILVFNVQISTAIKILIEVECSGREIFKSIRDNFKQDDKVIIEAMLVSGFTHEEALEAMLDCM